MLHGHSLLHNFSLCWILFFNPHIFSMYPTKLIQSPAWIIFFMITKRQESYSLESFHLFQCPPTHSLQKRNMKTSNTAETLAVWVCSYTLQEIIRTLLWIVFSNEGSVGSRGYKWVVQQLDLVCLTRAIFIKASYLVWLVPA